MFGIFIKGIFWAYEPKTKGDGYIVSILNGVEQYRVSVKAVAGLNPGDSVVLCVRPNVFNGRLYYSGEFVGKEELK